MKIRKQFQSVLGGCCLHLAAGAEEPMLLAENTTLLLRLKRPSEANGAGGNAIDIIRAKNSGRGHGDIGGTVTQGAHRHFPGNLHTRQVEGFNGVRVDMQKTLFGLRRIHHVTALDKLATTFDLRQQHNDFAGGTGFGRCQHQGVITQVLNGIVSDGHDRYSRSYCSVDR